MKEGKRLDPERESFKLEHKMDDESIQTALSILANADHPPAVFWGLDRAGHYDDNYVDFLEERGWRVYEREYSGTFYRWCEAGSPGAGYIDKIRRYLEPIASFLGVELTDELVLQNSPQTLLRSYGKAELIAQISAKKSISLPPYDVWVSIEVYRLPELPPKVVCLVGVL